MESTGFMKNVVKLVTKLLTGCAMLMIGIVGYLATTIVIVIIFLGIAGPIHVGFLVALLVVIVVFAKLMPRYSVEGAAYVEHLAGFKLFLNATEKDRLEFHHPPERTPELFQENLGFACALGVEQKWGEQFESVLTSATEIERSGTQRNGFARDMGFVHSFQNFSSAISSASAFPGSRSGSSGGGSSGGGGGGGGGGGW